MIRTTRQSDIDAILEMIAGSGQFDADGVEHVRLTLEQHFAGESDDVWLTADDGEAIGVAYCAPEPMTSGTWNLLMLWTREDRHGEGWGSALVEQLETQLADRQARLLLVETSGLPEFAAARAFYTKNGFRHEATVKDFFTAGDDKLILTKSLAAGPAWGI